MDLHVSLTGRRNLSGQLYRQIREAILSGRIKTGYRLPATRELAERIGVSRNTVLGVYDRLRSEGFLQARVGAGTYVGADVRPRAPSGITDSPLRARTLWDQIEDVGDLSATDAPFDLRPGIPDAARFPFAPWRARVSRQLRPRSVGKGAHIGPAGVPALRQAIADHVGVARAVRARPEDVFVTNGSQQALDLIGRVLLDPGDAVVVEEPGYPLAQRAFRAQRMRVVPVRVDEQGIVVEEIPDGVRVAYVTPSHQYPLGMPLSMERRQALLAWAREADAAIVEDDYDGEFRYGGRPLEPLQGLDGSGRVLYVGSLSKVMLPTLRLGFLVAPPSLHVALRKARSVMDWHTAVPVQAAAAEFIADGLLAKQVRRMLRVYSKRHRLILEILGQRFDGQLSALPSHGGLHLTAVLAPDIGLTDVEVASRAAANGVAVLPLSTRYLAHPPRQGLLIGYGAIETDRIEEAFERLRRCLDSREGFGDWHQ